MICCSRCLYLLAFFLLFAAAESFGQASCHSTAENSALVSLQFTSTADETPADAEKASCSKQSASVAVQAVKGEKAANAQALDCNPKDCEPCPLGCCAGFPGCCKAKAADAGMQGAKTAKAVSVARSYP